MECLAGFGDAREQNEGAMMTSDRGTKPYSAIEMLFACKGKYNEKG